MTDAENGPSNSAVCGSRSSSPACGTCTGRAARITEADNVLFTTLTMNTQALHLDAAFADDLAPFHQRLVNSMFTLSTLVGLSVAQLTQGTIVANLGFTEIAFPKPAVSRRHPLRRDGGDRQAAVHARREGEGIVTLDHVGRNQHGDIVATATRKTLVRTKPDDV